MKWIKRKLTYFLPVYIFFLSVCLPGCTEQANEQSAKSAEPWPTDAEVLFQRAEVLKYTQEQQRLEQLKLEQLGIDGSAPNVTTSE